jgi:hypothetical protein
MAIAPARAFYSFRKIGHRHQDASERDQHCKRKRGGPYHVHARPPVNESPGRVCQAVSDRGGVVGSTENVTATRIFSNDQTVRFRYCDISAE